MDNLTGVCAGVRGFFRHRSERYRAVLWLLVLWRLARCPGRLLVAAVIVSGSGQVAAAALCAPAWQQRVDAQLVTADPQVHGPDLGSAEWQSVVEFKLGLRGMAEVPAPDSTAWCDFIDAQIQRRAAPATGLASAVSQASPSFDCSQVEAGSIEALVCSDKGLARLDRQLQEVYRAATAKASREQPPTLRAEQVGWIKGRNDCWKSDDRRRCVADEYSRRIVELQARYQLVSARGPVYFFCDGNPANELVVTYYQTQPPTLMAERGDSTALMYRQPSASGSRYEGGNNQFWEHQGEARVVWGYGAKPMTCLQRPHAQPGQ